MFFDSKLIEAIKPNNECCEAFVYVANRQDCVQIISKIRLT